MNSRTGLYLAVTLIALALAFLLALQVLGAFFKLLFIVAVLLVAFAAIRAWLGSQAR